MSSYFLDTTLVAQVYVNRSAQRRDAGSASCGAMATLTKSETWLNLQSEYELRIVRRTAGEEIARTVLKREAA
jgi:hypothetical protein